MKYHQKHKRMSIGKALIAKSVKIFIAGPLVFLYRGLSFVVGASSRRADNDTPAASLHEAGVRTLSRFSSRRVHSDGRKPMSEPKTGTQRAFHIAHKRVASVLAGEM